MTMADPGITAEQARNKGNKRDKSSVSDLYERTFLRYPLKKLIGFSLSAPKGNKRHKILNFYICQFGQQDGSLP